MHFHVTGGIIPVSFPLGRQMVIPIYTETEDRGSPLLSPLAVVATITVAQVPSLGLHRHIQWALLGSSSSTAVVCPWWEQGSPSWPRDQAYKIHCQRSDNSNCYLTY
jgi:hypothetical protein